MVDNHQIQWWLQVAWSKTSPFMVIFCQRKFCSFSVWWNCHLCRPGPFAKIRSANGVAGVRWGRSWNNCSPTPPFLRTIRQRPNRGTSTFSLFSNFERLETCLTLLPQTCCLQRSIMLALLACTKTNYYAESMRELDWPHIPRFLQLPQMTITKLRKWFCQSNWLGNTKIWLYPIRTREKTWLFPIISLEKGSMLFTA